jgi:hypothetical protein
LAEPFCLTQPISLPVDGIPPGVPVLPPVVARLAPLAILDSVHLHLKALNFYRGNSSSIPENTFSSSMVMVT